jgi:flavin-dependent dehydrogenase
VSPIESGVRSFDALVIGAGPAGSAAARALARAGAQVLLCERGTLPRHRLCGEFLSPEAVADLQSLGLDLPAQGAVAVREASIASGTRAVRTQLTPPAYGLSRHRLDQWLAQSAASSGAELATRTRVAHLTGGLRRGFQAKLEGAQDGYVTARVVVGAFGKRTSLVRRSRGREDQAGAVALKVHLRVEGDLPPCVELHSFTGGYVGLAPVEGHRLNVCLVARPEALRGRAGGGVAGALGALVARLPAVAERWSLERVDIESACGASRMRFGKVHPVWRDVLLAGDAAALPHPLGGDGIAMALRAGRLAARHALDLLDGRTLAEDLAGLYERAWKREFESRLHWSAALHAALERPAVMRPLLGVFSAWPPVLDFLVERTRGASVPRTPGMLEEP